MRLSLDKNLGDRRVATETRVDSKTRGWCDGLADLRERQGWREKAGPDRGSLSPSPHTFVYMSRSLLFPQQPVDLTVFLLFNPEPRCHCP